MVMPYCSVHRTYSRLSRCYRRALQRCEKLSVSALGLTTADLKNASLLFRGLKAYNAGKDVFEALWVETGNDSMIDKVEQTEKVVDLKPADPVDTPTRRKGIYLLPNILTTGALFGGFYAVLSGFSGHLNLPLWPSLPL